MILKRRRLLHLFAAGLAAPLWADEESGWRPLFDKRLRSKNAKPVDRFPYFWEYYP